MINLVRTNAADQEFINLVKLLDQELSKRDGPEHAFYGEFNKIDKIRNVVVAFAEGKAIGCGAIKAYDQETMEIKRMYVKDEYRGKAVGGIILKELENWAIELKYISTILETGKRQPEAIRLYEKSGYSVISNYGQYIGKENSICMLKRLI